MEERLPPVDVDGDADGGLVRHTHYAGDHIIVQVMTAAEALDLAHALKERGSVPGPAVSADAPDKIEVAADGRRIHHHYTHGAKRQLKRQLGIDS